MEAVVYIGDNLRRLRILNALTQEELADKAGLTPATVARIERNETEPRPSTLRKLAHALGEEPRRIIETED
jgi:transcriptional regulator with XRE-family HTH domain